MRAAFLARLGEVRSFVSSLPASPSHHRPGGGYQNPWPQAQTHRFADFLRWRFVERRTRPLDPNPARDSLPKREPEIVTPRAVGGHRSVTWIGHSTVLLQLGNLNALTDPIWSERASPSRWIGPRRLMTPAVDFDGLPSIDVVLLSHNHYDHLDARTVRRIAGRFPDAAWLCPLGLGHLLRTFGVRHALERDWWQSVETPAFSATCAPAQHFSSRGLRDRGDTLWCSWAIEADDVRVYFGGDTGLHPEFGTIGTRLGPFDLVMLPIGAYEPRWFMRTVHLDPQDAVAAYGALADGGAVAPPCLALHWGTFRLTDEPVEEPPALFAQRWREAGFPDSANWTLAHGETRRLAGRRK
jgi:N-acyl-phosphatidylethanolamine-hydrolysing phospholipase D